MRLDEIKRSVFKIEQIARGEWSTPVKDEWARVCEQQLYLNVLRAIAAGAEHPDVLAKAALGTCLIPFDRWTE